MDNTNDKPSHVYIITVEAGNICSLTYSLITPL